MGLWDKLSSNVKTALRQDKAGGATGPGISDRMVPGGLRGLNDEALLVELERRRRARGATANRRVAGDEELDAVVSGRRARIRERPLSKCYAALELAPGATRYDIERAYRALLRKYHPDRHVEDPEAHRSAIALCAQLTDSYMALLASLEPGAAR